MIGSAYQRAVGDPIEAVRSAAGKVASGQARVSGILESMYRDLNNPKIPMNSKKKIMESIRSIKAKHGIKDDQSVMRSFAEQAAAGLKAGAKALPYALAIGSVEGALKILMEKFRTNPYLAPIDIRVRPDILESGLRTAVKTMGGKDISYALNVLRDAQENYRTISVEEYAQLSASTGTTHDEHKSIMRMAEAMNDIRSNRKQSFDDILSAQKMENQIHEIMGDAISRKIEQGMKDHVGSQKPHETSAAVKHGKRMAKVPMLPYYNIGEKDKKAVEEIKRRMESGKYWSVENKKTKEQVKTAAGEIMRRIKGGK
jgi:hypothetical protein